MRNRFVDFMMILGLAFGFMFFPLSAASQEKEPPDTLFKDDPLAHALYDKMNQALQDAQTLYYQSLYHLEMSGLPPIICQYKLWMKKPNYARMEVFTQGFLRGILVGDGEYFWIYWPNGRPRYNFEETAEYEKTSFNVYTKTLSPVGRHSLAHMIDKLGASTVMTVIEPSVFHGYIDPFDYYLDGVKSLGMEKVGEEECDIIEVRYMKGQRIRQLWLSREDHLPRKLKEVIQVQQPLIKEEVWMDLSLNQKMDDNKFSWKPPEDWKEWNLPEMKQGLLKPGTEAPDFDLTLSDGKKFKLSDQRGKVIWLMFWRAGCQSCREEMPDLSELYRKYKDKGLLVLGFDFADEKKIALDFLKENSADFPNIIDASEPANKVFFRDYQKMEGMSGVPLNYIIDREGKVADAWYGHDKEQSIKALEKLGIE
ncbi:MAG: redoxin domain-containing protein [Candidatus Zixiibacteriota bacterium]